MSIQWIHGRYKEDSRVFDSQFEAEEWADSLYSDIVGEGFVNVGYATPDKRVVVGVRPVPGRLRMVNPNDVENMTGRKIGTLIKI